MRDEFTALLLSQVGVHEGRDPDGTWNNHQRYSAETPGLEWSQDQPWCATFEAWGAHRTPGLEPLWPMTASCSAAVQWWQDHGRWSQYPVLGGPFYLGPGGGTHTGVVVAFDADTITTVEGNSNPGGSANGDGVYKRTRPRRGPGSPYGYGVPAYPEGTVSADPTLGGTPSAHVNPVSTPKPTIEEDPLMAFTEDDLRRFVREEVTSQPVRDQLAFATWWWAVQASKGMRLGPNSGQWWESLLPDLEALLTGLPAAAVEQIKAAAETALANGVVKVDVTVAGKTVTPTS